MYHDYPPNFLVVSPLTGGKVRRVSDEPIGTRPNYLGVGMEEQLEGFGEEFGRHKIVPLTDNKKRLCLICKVTKRRTAGGCRVSTRHKCGLCEVYLCKGERGCYLHYHQILYRRGGITDNPEKMVADAFGITNDNN